VRSTIETASFSAWTFEVFLIERVVYLATRSSIPTWSTGPISLINERREMGLDRAIAGDHDPAPPRAKLKKVSFFLRQVTPAMI
jgi:hypothetical protein